MLVIDPQKRMDFDELFNHPWVKQGDKNKYDCSELLKSVYHPLGTPSPKDNNKFDFKNESSSELENENYENDVNKYLGKILA